MMVMTRVSWRETREYRDPNFEPRWIVAEGHPGRWEIYERRDSEVRYALVAAPAPDQITRADQEWLEGTGGHRPSTSFV
jgi:hypothetical protein